MTIENLKSIVGDGNVLTSDEERTFFSADMASLGETSAGVVRPGSAAELSQVVVRCIADGYAVVPRGGGFSYTGGYVPVQGNTVTVDMRRMNRIVEINTEDMFVKVEVGCTWRELYEALKAKGYRTPYFGPMSGYWATVGGALSQGSFFLGSTQYGTVAESVLSLEVVLADGSIIHTGSAASQTRPSPFFRWYGPDLSGLFLSDTGAMGLKTQATLRLIPWPQHQRFGTFAFDDLAKATALVSEIGRQGLAAECYCWDPAFVKSVGERNGLAQDLRYLVGVVGSGSTWMRGIKDAARMALAGRRIFDGSTYLVHTSIDDISDAGAEERLKQIQVLAAAAGGGEIEASMPRATRGLPFANFKNHDMAATGARNLPTNALCPHSRVQELAREVTAFFEANRPKMARHDITHGVIVFAVGNTAMCVEPVMYWHDEQHRWHSRTEERSDLGELRRFDGPSPATSAVGEIRKDLIALFTRLGCAHVQIGKSYRYADTRQPDALKLIQGVKNLLDPHHRINPGSLGL